MERAARIVARHRVKLAVENHKDWRAPELIEILGRISSESVRDMTPPSAVLEVWSGDFDFAYRSEPGGVLTVTMHPQVIGRGHRMLMLERFLDHVQAHDDVEFTTLATAADAYRAAVPFSG